MSFYALPSSVLGNDKHSLLREAYCWYLFADTTTLPDLLNDALILAKRLHFDVFNALEIGENDRFLQARSSPHCSLRSPLSHATWVPARAALRLGNDARLNLPCSPRLSRRTQPSNRTCTCKIPIPNPSPGPKPQPRS